jgi:hypothetical protein
VDFFFFYVCVHCDHVEDLSCLAVSCTSPVFPSQTSLFVLSFAHILSPVTAVLSFVLLFVFGFVFFYNLAFFLCVRVCVPAALISFFLPTYYFLFLLHHINDFFLILTGPLQLPNSLPLFFLPFVLSWFLCVLVLLFASLSTQCCLNRTRYFGEGVGLFSSVFFFSWAFFYSFLVWMKAIYEVLQTPLATLMEPLSPPVNRTAGGEDNNAVPRINRSRRRSSGSCAAALSTTLHSMPRGGETSATSSPCAIRSRENTPHLSYDFVSTCTTAATVTGNCHNGISAASTPQRSSHYLPQLNFAEDVPRSSPLTPFSNAARDIEDCDEGRGAAAVTQAVASPTTLSEGSRRPTSTFPPHTRRLIPLSPLSLTQPSAATPTTSTVQALPNRDGTWMANACTISRTFGGHAAEVAPRASSTKTVVFEQRRIPLPPPAVVATVTGENTCSGNGKINTTNTTSTTTINSDSGAEARQGRGESSTCVHIGPHNLQKSPQESRPTSTASSASFSANSHSAESNSGLLQSTTSPSLLSTVSPSPEGGAARTMLFVPVSFGVGTGNETQCCGCCSTDGVKSASVRAPNSLRHASAVQFPLPPMPPAESSATVSDGANCEQAQMVRDLLQWRRGRNRRLLSRSHTTEDPRYDVQPVTVQSSRPSRVLDSKKAGNSDDAVGYHHPSNVRDAGVKTEMTAVPGMPPKTLDMDKTLSAIEVLSAVRQPSHPQVLSALEAASRRLGKMASRSMNDVTEEAARQQEASPLRQHQHSRQSSSRSYPSLASRSSTPDCGIADGGGSGVLLRKNDASPKHGGNGGASLRHSLPSDRPFARPSSTLMTDSHREGSGWSRSEIGGPWGGSSRHLNLSTLTISCAPGLGSFSTNSDSSLFP